MDDGETHPSEMQTDGLDPGDNAQVSQTLLASASDENENRLGGSTCEAATTVDAMMAIQEHVEEDSINNNESCNHSDGPQSDENGCREKELERPCAEADPGSDPKLTKEKRASGKRSSRSKKGLNGALAGFSSAETTTLVSGDMSEDAVQGNALEANSNHQLGEQKQLLQSLFSLIREEFEQNDVASLPTCLHQVAETYYQDEEYEKAIQFIQLERLYQEQLLANLSAIQEQWETKWKKTVPEKRTSRNSEKGLNSDELWRLAHLCSSHREPTVSKRKRTTPEKIVAGGTATKSVESEEPSQKAADCKSDCESWPGVSPRRESQEGVAKTSASSALESCADCLAEDGRRQEKEHMEEPHDNDELTHDAHAQSPGPVGRPCSDCLPSGDVSSDTSILLLDRTHPSEDVASRAEISAELKEAVPMVDSLAASAGLDSEPTNGRLKAERNSLRLKHCDDSTGAAGGLIGIELLDQQLPGLGGNDSEKPPQDRTDCCDEVGNDKAVGHAHDSLPEAMGREAPEQGKDTEESVNLDCSSDDSEILGDEEASYSLGEAVLEDNSISLDELAKRIEVEEIAPAEGLVSILKKQSESEGKKLAQIQQKQAKRRVRFEVMDDALEQEDLGGGSCFVLILLCAATVLLSVGGTALYCTFGYVASPVCTDFAENMDFYYTWLLQGMDELKHWFSFS